MTKQDILSIIPAISEFSTSMMDAEAGYVFVLALRKAFKLRAEMAELRSELIARFKVPSNGNSLDITSPEFVKLSDAWNIAAREEFDLEAKSLTYEQLKPLFDENKVKVSLQCILMDIFVKE